MMRVLLISPALRLLLSALLLWIGLRLMWIALASGPVPMVTTVPGWSLPPAPTIEDIQSSTLVEPILPAARGYTEQHSVAAAPPELASIETNSLTADPGKKLRMASMTPAGGGTLNGFQASQMHLLSHLLRRPAPQRSWEGFVGTPFAAQSGLTVSPSRWRGAAWAVWRQGSSPSALLPTLGGSQAGVRLAWAANEELELYGRVTVNPGRQRRPMAAEAAAGLAVRPSPRSAFALLVERREPLSPAAGRGRFVAALAGGGTVALSPRLQLDGYGAAGVSGMSRPQPFAEGSVRAARALGSYGPVDTEVGIGAWAATQTGAHRLDVGPTIAARLPDQRTRVAVDWRQRVAGTAAPGSGVAVTMGLDF